MRGCKRNGVCNKRPLDCAQGFVADDNHTQSNLVALKREQAQKVLQCSLEWGVVGT